MSLAVIGRDAELGLALDLVEADAQRSRRLGVRGAPGIGKTAIWKAWKAFA